MPDLTPLDLEELKRAIDLLEKRCVEIDGHYQRIPNASPEPRITANAIRAVLASHASLINQIEGMRERLDRWEPKPFCEPSVSSSIRQALSTEDRRDG